MRQLIHCLPCTVALAAITAAPHSTRELGHAAPSQDASRWTISEQALVDIGADGTDTLILRAGSALRLATGAIVVGANRNSQLQFFDAAGRHYKTAGRRGQGPHEFGGNVYVYAGRGDTIVAHDERNRRYHYLTPAGEFVKLDTLGDVRRKSWMYDRTIVARIPGPLDFAQLRQTIARIPFTPRDTIRTALVTQTGNVWVRDPSNPQAYSIFARDGRPLGTVAIPAKFSPFQILDTLIVGRWTDQDDVEHVQVRKLTPGRAPAGTPAPPRPVYDESAEWLTSRALIDYMRRPLRNLGTAQEAYFADNVRYASTLEPLRGRVALPDDVTFTMFAASRNGYGVIAQHASLKTICVLALFAPDLPGEWVLCG